jgi:hypothetical protein
MNNNEISSVVFFLIGFLGCGLVFVGAMAGNKTCVTLAGLIALFGALGCLIF